jgi:hypothetical protein
MYIIYNTPNDAECEILWAGEPRAQVLSAAVGEEMKNK